MVVVADIEVEVEVVVVVVFFWRCDSILTSLFASFQTHVDERQVVEGIVKFQKAVSELPGMHGGAELWHDLRGLQTVVSQAICYKCEALLAVALQQGAGCNGDGAHEAVVCQHHPWPFE